MSLLCKLFGHAYVYSGTDMEGMCEVICTRCDTRTKWPRDVFCKRGDHEWKPAGVDHYTKTNIFSKEKSDELTRRTWKCAHCSEIKQDDTSNLLPGTWLIVDGAFVHAAEIRRRYAEKLKIVRTKE